MASVDDVVLYQGEEWSALYVDDRLLEIGDHYLVEERLLDVLGIEFIQSDDFLRGGSSREDAAKTLDEIESYQDSRDSAEAMAALAEAAVRSAEDKLAAAQAELDRAKRLRETA